MTMQDPILFISDDLSCIDDFEGMTQTKKHNRITGQGGVPEHLRRTAVVHAHAKGAMVTSFQ